MAQTQTQTIRAITIDDTDVRKVIIRDDVPIPRIPRHVGGRGGRGGGWILVRVKAVAINPTDVKHIDGGNAVPGLRVGCDYAGVVMEVGDDDDDDDDDDGNNNNENRRFQVGDRVFGFVHGCDRTNPQNGSFGEILIAKAATQLKIPRHMSYEEAATLGVALATVGQGLYKSLGLKFPLSSSSSPLPPSPSPSPTRKKPFILIYGASTATGLVAVQCAAASPGGYRVLATCSPRNFPLVLSMGAEAVFDYHDGGVEEKIRRYINSTSCIEKEKERGEGGEGKGKLKLAWDCTGLGARVCVGAMMGGEEEEEEEEEQEEEEDEECVYGTILPVSKEEWDGLMVTEKKEEEEKKKKKKIRGPLFTLAYDVLGEEYEFMGGQKVGAKPEEVEFAVRWLVGWCEGALERGELKGVRAMVDVGGDGLEGVLKGLDIVRRGEVSGGKMVYTL